MNTLARYKRSRRWVCALWGATLTLLGCGSEATQPPPASIPEPQIFDVFVSGDGYHTYRIPALITTRSGVLLAFAEGRVDAHFDKSMNDIVLRRSFDLGESWEPLQMLHDVGEPSLNDPTPVQIRAGPNQGRILLMFEQIPCRSVTLTECESLAGVEHVNLVMHSDNDGETWSPAQDVTAEVRQPGGTAGVGPGIAIQKTFAPHAGRIVFPFRGLSPTKNYVVYSDDGGDTWLRGEIADDSQTVGGGNEVQVVELSDGTLMLNARNTDDTGFRKVARSADGGETWSPLADDDELVDSMVMASILRFSDGVTEDAERLLFSNPSNPVVRFTGTVRLSYDGGDTWPIARNVWDLVFGYSVLTRLDCRNVGLLFEDGINSQRLAFIRFSISWLTDGEDEPTCRD